MTKALYSGSFDPMTNGHLDVIERASKMFDQIVVGVVSNLNKVPLFGLKERKELIKTAIAHLPNVTVDDFDGLLANYVNQNGFNAVIRGLRATSDFEYEIQMAQMNARLFNEGIESIFLMTSPKYSFISSSMIKEVVSLNGNIDGLVPENILNEIKKKYSL